MGRVLQVVGVMLMTVGLCGMLLNGRLVRFAFAEPCSTPAPHAAGSSAPGAVPADAAASASPLPTDAPNGATPPEPQPSAQPCPTRRHRSLFGSGPITLSGTGGIDIGDHSQGSSMGFSQSQTQTGANLALQLARRTAQTSLVVDQGIGALNKTYNVGQINVAYSTPKYLLNYGQVNGPNDTQLSQGAFNRGLTLVIPHGQAEWDLIGARALGSNGSGQSESFTVGGIRHSAAIGRGLLFSQTFYSARGDADHGLDNTLDIALGSYKTGDTLRGELAYSMTHGLAGVPDGGHFAYALHADFAGLRSSESLAFTSIPTAYAALGQVQFAQRALTATLRRRLGTSGVATFQVNDLSSDVYGQSQKSINENGALQFPFLKSGTIGLQQSLQTNHDSGGSFYQRLYGITLGEIVLNTALSESYSATTFNGNVAAIPTPTPAPGQTPLPLPPGPDLSGMQHQYSFQASRQLFRGFLNYNVNVNRTFQGGGTSSIISQSYGYSHPFGQKAQLALLLGTENINGNDPLLGTSTSSQRTLGFTLTRRISPVLALQLNGGRTIQTGGFSGSAHYLNVDITGPLAFGGAARYAGRPNPNLPAIVTGHVFYIEPSSDYGVVGNRGIANVLVTLDSGQTQRTDSNGEYEFQFVRPGQHTVTISDATLPVGTVPDSTTQTISIQGGQLITLDFAAGSFAGVQGVVRAQDANGNAPVQGVSLLVDGRIQGSTGPDGRYEIGHLEPGKHLVKIETETLPATVQLSGPGTLPVDVGQGQVATLDWQLVGLGSIQGSVISQGANGLAPVMGVRNVYAVAEPGEHAAITDDSGNFYIDNLPAGDYTVTLDEDSLPDGLGVAEGPSGVIHVSANQSVTGLIFKLGAAQKKVVFTFVGGGASALSAYFAPTTAPPGATVELRLDGHEGAKSVTATGAFGKVRLRYSAAKAGWIGKVTVPALKNGSYKERVQVNGGKGGSAAATLSVDAKIPLLLVRTQPAHPRPGEQVHVLMRILADVAAGDEVRFEDGVSLKLPTPSGRLFSFDVRMWSHPGAYQGIVINGRGQRFPFSLGP